MEVLHSGDLVDTASCLSEQAATCASSATSTATAFQGFQKLPREDVRKLLMESRYLLSDPNVVSLSYSHERKQGVRTGRKVLRVGVRTEPELSVEEMESCLPKCVAFKSGSSSCRRTLEIPVQVVKDRSLEQIWNFSPFHV